MTAIERPTRASVPFNPLVLIGAAVVVLCVVTVAVVLLGGRSAETYPADSPEAMLQRYLGSFDERDYEAAYAHFSTDVKERTDLETYLDSILAYGYPGDQVTRRIFIDEVSGSGDSRVMHMTVEEFYSQDMGGSSYRSERQIRAIREPDGWHIDELLVWLDPAPFFDEPF